MGSIPLHYVDLRTFCYVTEDESRVERALRTFLPEDCEIDRDVSQGHHGDRIVLLSTRIETASDMTIVLDRIRASGVFDAIREQLDDRVDENCAFYLTFDKQAAYRGEITLGQGITFRTKVESYPASRSAAIQNVHDFLWD